LLTKRNIIERKNIRKMKKELIEVREQIQEDLMTILCGVVDEGKLTQVCQIIVDNFNKLKK
jgi:hypothetical protein